MSEKLWFTRKEFCEETGFTKQRLHQIIKAGHIQKHHMDNRGPGRHKSRIRKAEALQDIANSMMHQNSRPKSVPLPQPGQPVDGATSTTPAPIYPEDPGAAVAACGFSRLTGVEARAEGDRQKAAKMKMENDKAMGELIPVADVAKQAFDSARLTRDAILSVPDRMAAELASVTDVHEINDRLTRELTQALEDLAESLS